MTYIIAFLVLLALTAVAAAARIAAYYRRGATDAPGRQARTKDRRTTLRPAFHIGATPVPQGVGPQPGDQQLRREFDLDSSDGHGRAA